MTLTEAYEKLTEYADGGLETQQRREMDELIASNPGLSKAYDLTRLLNVHFEEQIWIEPSANFVRRVVTRALVEAPRPLPAWLRMWEPTKIGVSFFTVGLLLALSGQTLVQMGMEGLRRMGVWLDVLTGSRVFELNPMIVLALVLPVLVGGWATCVVTGRCRVDT